MLYAPEPMQKKVWLALLHAQGPMPIKKLAKATDMTVSDAYVSTRCLAQIGAAEIYQTSLDGSQNSAAVTGTCLVPPWIHVAEAQA